MLGVYRVVMSQATSALRPQVLSDVNAHELPVLMFPYGGLDEVTSTYLLPTRITVTLDSAKLPVLAPCLSHIWLPMI